MSPQNYYKEKINFSALDAIRGIASLYVLVAHCRGVLWLGIREYLNKIPRVEWDFGDYFLIAVMSLTRLSTEFVILFFVLSGFSIAHSVRRSTSVWGFAKRRFIRLYPPYLAAIVWTMLVFSLVAYLRPDFVNGTYDWPSFDRLEGSKELFTLPEIIKNLLYVPNTDSLNRPFWSLTYEVIFYILSFALLSRKKLFYPLSIVFFFIGVIIEFALPEAEFSESIPYLYLFKYNFYFMIGVYLYHNYKKILKFFPKKKRRVYLLILATLFYMLVANALTGKSNSFSDLGAAFLSYLLIIFLLEFNVKWKYLEKAGAFSYTLYITHFASIFIFLIAYYEISKQEPPLIWNPFLFLLAIPFCLLIAYLHYLCIEYQTKRVLNKMRKKLKP